MHLPSIKYIYAKIASMHFCVKTVHSDIRFHMTRPTTKKSNSLRYLSLFPELNIVSLCIVSHNSQALHTCTSSSRQHNQYSNPNKYVEITLLFRWFCLSSDLTLHLHSVNEFRILSLSHTNTHNHIQFAPPTHSTKIT